MSSTNTNESFTPLVLALLTDSFNLFNCSSVNKANTKGVKDSLVLVDDIAFVVNVKDKAVVTVMNKDEMKENVFSNIDGAVIA